MNLLRLLFTIVLAPLLKGKYAVAKIVAGLIVIAWGWDAADQLSFEIPPFSALAISEGTITYPAETAIGRRGPRLGLVTGNSITWFSCLITPGGTNYCLERQWEQPYLNKKARVWYTPPKLLSTSHFLFQLEVEGKVVLPYEKQVEKYGKDKRSVSGIIYATLSIGIICAYLIICVMVFVNSTTKNDWKQK
jgi:hypothetical protein